MTAWFIIGTICVFLLIVVIIGNMLGPPASPPETPTATTEDPRPFFDALLRNHAVAVAASDSKLSVPVYALFKDVGVAIKDIMDMVNARDMRVAGNYRELRKTLRLNVARASKADPYDPKAKLIQPDEYDADPEELIRQYLKGTPFQESFLQRVPFEIPRERWEHHALILAPTGWGKSQLTGLFMREAIEDPQQRAIILLDPHGDLYREAKARIPRDRLVAIDPDENPPDLNILDYGVLSQDAAQETFEFLMASLAGGLSPKQQTSLSHLFKLLKIIPDASLVTLHEIVSEQAKKPAQFKEPISRLDDISRKFFETLWYTGNYQETRDALHWKLDSAFKKPAFQKMFSAKRNSIDIARFMQEKKIVLVKGGETALGKEGMRLFLLFLIGQYHAAGKARDPIPQDERELAMMFVDEASYVLQAPIIASVLKELRKYKCSFVAATQLWFDVGDDVRPAVLGNTGTFMFGKLGVNEAKSVAPDIEAKPEFIRSLKNVPRSHAEWCCYVQTVTDKPVVVTAPYGLLEAMPHVKEQRRFTQAGKPDRFEAAEGPSAKKPPEPSPSASVRTKPTPKAPTRSTDEGPPVKPGKDWTPR